MAALPEIEGYSHLVRVARGGFGTVYRAREERHGRLVALKVLDVSGLDARSRKRFARECVAMGSLSWHPNVVALYDSGITTGGQPWLAMEYLGAGSLGDRLRQGPLSWQLAVDAGIQVAGALGAAHVAGTLHRDLKPENLLIGPFGEIQLGDFGIAAIEGSSRTTTGHTTFTAAHVAPELLRGLRPDERTDVYGLASTLYTLMTGTPPMASPDAASFATQMARVLSVPPRRLEHVPTILADVIARCLAKDPDERLQSAADLGRALQRVQAENGVPLTELRLVAIGDPGPSATGADRVDDPAPGPSETLLASPPAHPAVGDGRPTVRRPSASPAEQTAPASAGAARGSGVVAARPAPDLPPGPPATPRPDRRRPVRVAATVIVLLAAVAVGWLALRPSDDTPVPDGTAASTTVATVLGEGATQATSVPPADLSVVVANGSGLAGAGAALSEELTGAGYESVLPPTDAPSDTSVSTVYFAIDDSVSYESDAQAVAETIGLDPDQVQPLPTDLAVERGGAAVVVVIGGDWAP